MKIRYTCEDDWPELRRVRLAALRDAPTAFGVTHASAAAYADADWRNRAAGRGPARYLLALDDDRAVGIVAHVPAAQSDLNLIAMWVEPAQRGTSAAGRLVQAVQAHALEYGHARVVLDVSPDNLRAAAFYRRMGFVFLPQWEPLESHPHIQVQKMAWPAPVTVTMALPQQLQQVAAFYAAAGYGGGVSRSDTVLCAESGARLVGVARLCEEQGDTVLRGMQVHPDFQRRGVGKLLLTHCAPHLRKRMAWCLPYEHLARFYARAGFAVVQPSDLPAFLAERQARYLAQGQRVLAMRRQPD